MTGELVMQWGIFWRMLKFDLTHCGPIIEAAMHLHNFLVDECEASAALASSNAGYFSGFSAAQIVEQDDNMDPNAE